MPRPKGFKHSEETKRKMRENHANVSGINHPNYGKHLSEQHRKRIGDGNRNKFVSSDTRKKLSELNKGKHHTEESKKKMREAQKGKHCGNKHHFFGKHLSEEHREKLREISLRNGNRPPSLFGKHHSFETKRKIGSAQIGEKNHNWKGGKVALRELIRRSFKYRQWRSDVFTRDNFTCQECFVKGWKLEAHHIKEYSLIVEENNIKTLEDALECEELWNINNGITLCINCHGKYNGSNQHKRKINN